MEISKIRSGAVAKESIVSKPADVKSKDKDGSINQKNNQYDIFDKTVTSLFDSLNNISQVENSHPLGRSTYKPIDNFEEALKELKFFQDSSYMASASNVHSGITAEGFLSLINDY